MIIEIHAREICPECKGVGHPPHAEHTPPAHQRVFACSQCGGRKYIEKWLSLEDLQLSLDLTVAIREAFAKTLKT